MPFGYAPKVGIGQVEGYFDRARAVDAAPGLFAEVKVGEKRDMVALQFMPDLYETVAEGAGGTQIEVCDSRIEDLLK